MVQTWNWVLGSVSLEPHRHPSDNQALLRRRGQISEKQLQMSVPGLQVLRQEGLSVKGFGCCLPGNWRALKFLNKGVTLSDFLQL